MKPTNVPGKQNNPLSRRQFLAASTAGSAMAASLPRAAIAAEASSAHLLKEHGFWDYTTPGCGGMGEYQKQDYTMLLDDMAAAGMNSLCILVKWLTTGYRSSLPYLDQLPGCPVIASDNRLLQDAIAEAGRRKIKVWLGAVVSYFDARKFTDAKPWHIFQDMGGYKLPMGVGAYAADEPVLTERAIQIFEELVDIFPGVSGLVVELESSGIEQPERIPRYNQWAKENNRPAFEKLGHPFNPRYFDVTPWRDYTSEARFKLLRELEKALRGRGFEGELSMICETGSYTNSAVQEVNLQEYRKQFPRWKTITYEYEKYMNRYAMMDFCIETPKLAGLEVYYLPRGIMTWGMKWPLPISLEESWRRDIEDIQMFQPHSVWWFGSGTVGDGTHVSLARIQKSGYRDGVDARRALIRATSGLKVMT